MTRRRHEPLTLDFGRLRTVEVAFLHLQCSPDLARDLFSDPTKYYRGKRVPRRSGSTLPRIVYDVDNDLRRIHRTIALGLRPLLASLPEDVQGFRQGHSILSNAARHCERPVVVTADLQDFFGTITLADCVTCFEKAGSPRQVAILLARLCTLGNSLPQGSRASPAIANLVATRLDVALHEAFPDVTYTRYADDLSLSGECPPECSDLARVIESAGFRLRVGSYRRQARGRGQYVTGLNVEGTSPRIPRRVRRRLLRDLWLAEKHSIFGHLKEQTGHAPSLQSIDKWLRHTRGMIVSYARVEPELFLRWAAAFSGPGRTSLPPRPPV
jgi:RNA-directed DNA polymerase